jgi:hypothetical protein
MHCIVQCDNPVLEVHGGRPQKWRASYLYLAAYSLVANAAAYCCRAAAADVQQQRGRTLRRGGCAGLGRLLSDVVMMMVVSGGCVAGWIGAHGRQGARLRLRCRPLGRRGGSLGQGPKARGVAVCACVVLCVFE